MTSFGQKTQAGKKRVDAERAGDPPEAQHDLIEALLNTTTALIIVMDSEARIERFNKACEKLSGLTATQIHGKQTWEVLVPPEERGEVRRAFEEVRHEGFPIQSENHWQLSDGSRRLIAWSRSRVLDESGALKYVLATGIDITEQRRAQQEARSRQAEVARMHRLFAIAEVASLIAHELNQPLSAIANYGALSLGQLERREDGDQLRHNIREMVEQAHRASRSIRQLRQFITEKQPDKETTDLREALQFACSLVEELAQARGVRLNCASDASLPPVVSPAIQIEHVIVNLLQNALDAMRDAGKRDGIITVRARLEEGNIVRVSVEDNGPGLDRSLADKVFEPHYTTTSDGLGLGLAISRSIIEALGGHIWAEPGPGGKFYFTLLVAP